MRVLVSGGAGYIGSVLVPLLLEREHTVRVLDSGFFGLDHLPQDAEVISEDVLDFQDQWLDGIDAIIHLAGLSNDPMADFSPKLNYEVNAAGSAVIAQAAKRTGVRRFIMGSTCSVYGFTEEHEVDEEWLAKPAYPYAISKLMAERALQCLADDSFRPIVFRKGTVIGWSPRMRYDLVANTMLKSALTQGQIIVRNPNLWRPILDVRDAAAAYISAVESDGEISGTFNIACGNFTIAEIADQVNEALQERGLGVPIVHQDLDDVRNYRVSTSRARNVLNFTATIPVRASVSTMLDHIQEGINADFDNPRYYNIEWMKISLAQPAFPAR
jgi:nucleoside-diphosphate-sugar epimerase